MKIIIVTLTIFFVCYLYFFTINQQTKETRATEKPPERNKTPTTEISREEEQRLPEGIKTPATERSREDEQRLHEGTKTAESKRLPDVVIIGVKKSGTMTLSRRERRVDIQLIIYYSVTQTSSSVITPTLWWMGKMDSLVSTNSTGGVYPT